MTTAHAGTRPRLSGLRAALAARAVVAAALAVLVTFTPGHTSAFGLIAVGVFEPLIAVSLLIGLRSAQRGRRARIALAVRAAVLIVVGLVALLAPAGVRTPAGLLLLLVVLEVVAFAVGGACELVGGLAPGEPPVQRRDAITMGGLQLVAAAMLALVNTDAVFAIGVLGAWAAIVAVYLGIAAASVGRPGAR